MTDIGGEAYARPASRPKTRRRVPRKRRHPLRPLGRAIARRLPKGLLARSILIVVLPIVLLQGVVALVFMERHWELVTRRLSQAVALEIAALVRVLESYPQDAAFETIEAIARETLNLNLTVLPPGPLPKPAPKPFFALLDRTLARELTTHVGKPFWISTIGRSNFVEIRIKLDDAVLRIYARQSRAYASNSHIFLVWMISASLLIVLVALLFLRNQIKPILQLAGAAERFGKGRPVGDYEPRGAREVREAGRSFRLMAERIDRQIAQRTMMLSGVSHDLRTILTRFQLELAILGDDETTVAMREDIEEMTRILNDYLAFARGDNGEVPGDTDMRELLHAVAEEARRGGARIDVSFEGDPIAIVRAGAVRRMLGNLVGNSMKYAEHVALRGARSRGWVEITIDDDGPGIPVDEREAVFRPFHRLDAARNIDEVSTGLGLAIVRDIARSHGGDVVMEDSPMGGNRARVTLPA